MLLQVATRSHCDSITKFVCFTSVCAELVEVPTILVQRLGLTSQNPGTFVCTTSVRLLLQRMTPSRFKLAPATGGKPCAPVPFPIPQGPSGIPRTAQTPGANRWLPHAKPVILRKSSDPCLIHEEGLSTRAYSSFCKNPHRDAATIPTELP